MSPQIRYRIYPSLLDKFQDYLNPERLMVFNKTEEEIEQELINTINRVPFISEAADKGNAFNKLVDHFVKHPSEAIPTVNDGKEVIYQFTSQNGEQTTFSFPANIVREFVAYFKGSVPQVYCSATLYTKYGLVEVYSLADELRMDRVYDIKTTSRYEFPKYLNSWQRFIYPYCLNEQGIAVQSFEFTITDFKNTYKELYPYDHKQDSQKIRLHCEHFIEYIEARRHLITDTKIFGM